MSDLMSIKIDATEYRKTELKLGPYKQKAPLVMSRALNRAAQTARKTASEVVRQQYTLKSTDVRKTFRLQKASRGRLTAVLISSGEHLGLTHFKHSPRTPRPKNPPREGLKVSVTKGKQTQFRHAFIADFYGLKIFQREGKSRLPIRKLVGPSVPQIVGGLKVRPRIESEAAKMYLKRLDHEIKRTLEGNK
jgi:hypothetical protein